MRISKANRNEGEKCIYLRKGKRKNRKEIGHFENKEFVVMAYLLPNESLF